VYNTIVAEKSGKPSVALVNQGFVGDSKSAASGRGCPEYAFIRKCSCECSVNEDIERGIERYWIKLLPA
jgi:hypothetical protein